jgi:predicted ester cyclase
MESGITKADYFALLQHNCQLDSGHQKLLATLYAPDCQFHISAPVEHLDGTAQMAAHFWAPLLRAFPDLERRTDILLTGQFKDGDWFASSGFLVGHFEQPLFGIKPSGRPHWLRYGWFDRVEGGRVFESYVILDIARLLIEVGQWPLRPQLGESWSPAPQTQDGVALKLADPTQSQKSLDLVEAMIAGLMQYDRQSLASMGMARFWTPQFHWYGPGGIGSARGHRDYERAHQQPFLTAFPDRVGGNHKCRIGDGSYVASTGWPSINATHMGDGWIGVPATNKRITQRIMDFWRREEDLLAENWVFIDMVDLLGQMGVQLLPDYQPEL